MKRLGESEISTDTSSEIPNLGTFDVVVCGGGPSGIFAATAAATTGARTLLIERYGFIGGMATAGLVGPISKFNLDGERIVGGMPLRFIERLAARNGAIIDLPSGNVPFDPEIYKTTAADMLLDSGVRLLLHSLVVGCDETDDGRINRVYIETPSRKSVVLCNYVIDCTGTGRLVADTALELKIRGDAANSLQPMSLIFRLGGVDTDALEILMANDGTKYRNATLRPYLQAALDEGRISNFGGPWTVWGSVVRKGYVSVNATRYSGDALNVYDLTEAEISLRREIEVIVDTFRSNAPEFRSCHVVDVATQVGIRETRSIDGEYTLTGDDVLGPAMFSDTVALGGHPVDIHHPDDPKQTVRFIQSPYGIPFRSILPRGSHNVLASVGLISADRDAFASVRVQAQCMAIGQAAGTAAAICNSAKCDVGDIDVSELLRTLKEQGAITGV
jgi:hypothetical protein